MKGFNTAKHRHNRLRGESNLYAFVDNNPISRIDPKGLSWFKDFLNNLFPTQSNPADIMMPGGMEAYLENQAFQDYEIDYVMGDDYSERERIKIRHIEHMVPNEIFVLAGAGKKIKGAGGAEAMCLYGGNMMNGNTYIGGLVAGGVGIGKAEFSAGGEWTSSSGFTGIGISELGWGGGYHSGEGSGFFLATPTPIFIGVGFGWSDW